MRRILVYFSSVLFVLAITSQAIQLKEEPIQQALQNSLANSHNSDVPFIDQLSSSNITWGTESENDNRVDKSILKAAGYSLLLPGLGQYYNNHRTKAKFFFGAEAMTWAAFIAFRTYGGWKRDDYIRFGNVNAGAQLDGKDERFYTLLEDYDNLHQYNNLGRLLEPGAPYLENTPENYWRWQSLDDRGTYTRLRRQSRNAYKRGDWMIVVAVLNRVISVIDAIRDVRRDRNNTDESIPTFGGVRYKLELSPLAGNRQVGITIYPGF